MTMIELARLNATEELPGRTFTNPEHSHADAAILRYMRHRLLETLRDADIGPCVWTQQVDYTFGGWHFEQDEWIHVARCDGTSSGPGGLEHLEAIAFGEQRWWAVEDVVAHRPRTIPYRMVEFIEDLASGGWPESPIDITPEVHHVEAWRNHDR